MSTSKHIQIVYGSPNVTFVHPNKFVFRLPAVYASGNEDKISVKSVRLYYSWFNLSTAKNNNAYSYKWIDGLTYPVHMNDGIWGYSDFQSYLEQTMLANGHYLIDASSQKQYYISLVANSVFYRISLLIKAVPASLPTGFSAPPGFVFPAVASTPQLVLPATDIQKYLGITAGSYPSVAQATNYAVNSQTVPQVTTASSLILYSNLTLNEYSPDSRTICSFNVIPGTAPGSLISEVPYYQDWIPVQPASKFTTIELSVVDQSGTALVVEDPAGFICTLNLQSNSI